MVTTKFRWEVPQPAHVLVACALARARPAALAAGVDRIGGLPDSVVAERYAALASAIASLGDRGSGRSLQELESEPAERGYPAWETLVMRTGADEDATIVELAQAVWQALGPNEYAIHLRDRPRTLRGFWEGRTWLQVGALGLVALVFAAFLVRDRWGLSWWLSLPVIAAWPVVLVWQFLQRYRRGQRRGGEELPHF